ncbi:MAG: hypothetical protein ACI9MC_001946 [Kiritimatiellia bacterium]|jgi:hypothetical protein
MLPWLLLLGSAHAFEVSTNKFDSAVSWDVMPVYWQYDDTGRPGAIREDRARLAVQSSFAEWNNVRGAKVVFIEVDGAVPADQINLIVWEDDWQWDADILALTSTWSTEGGEIVGFRIVINGDDPTWSTDGAGMDLQNALTHEVGHAVGLAHDSDHKDATMAPTAKEGEVRKRDLHWSDEDGARFLYPGDDGVGCNTIPAPANSVFLLPLLAVAARRRSA